MVYAFQSTDWSKENDPWFLAWQPNTYDDGYFWTRKSVFVNCINCDYDVDPHRFTCENMKDAVYLAKKIKLKRYKIVKLNDVDA